MTVVIVFFFSKNNFNILTTEENFEGQRFAILAMFLYSLCWENRNTLVELVGGGSVINGAYPV